MDRKLPANLIFLNSRLKIFFQENSEVNRTNSAIIITGTREGFLTLANAILFYSNDLEEKINLHEMPFIQSSIRLTIQCWESTTKSGHGDIQTEDNKNFIWKIAESDIDHIAASIHSLGHINPKIHLDEGKEPDEISVYCVVE